MINFSFLYDNVRYTPANLNKIDQQVTTYANYTETVETYSLDVLKITRVYKAFGNAEYSLLRFENTSTANSGILSEICDADEAFPLLKNSPPAGFCGYGKQEFTRLIRVFGSNGNDQEFNTHTDVIRNNSTIRFNPNGGRSSQGFAPFFEVQHGEEGVLLAIGWTGQWFSEITGENENVRFKAGVDKLSFFLKPNESVRTASVLKVPYSNGTVEGHIAFKRIIKNFFSPKIERPLPFLLSFWGGSTTDFLLQQLDMIDKSKMPFDAFWLDAGWYGHHTPEKIGEFDESWGGQTGSWECNPLLHPNGLLPVAKKVKEMGFEFMLWFEPERVCTPSDYAEQYPHLLLKDPEIKWCALLDLSQKEGEDLMYNLIARYVEELDLDYYRQDFNIDPLSMWEANEEENRKGYVQLKYIEGMYNVWDRLLERFPKLIIDNCASGGRRIDIETLSRSIPVWRSDYQCSFDSEAEAAQNHNMGISAWVPYSATGIGQYIYDRYNVRSCYSALANSSCYGYAHVADRTMDCEQLSVTINEFRAVREYFSCDYYPIFSGARDHASWGGWQFNRPEQKDGLIMAFRRDKSPFSCATVQLGGLKADKNYKLVSYDGEAEKVYSGEELLTKGLTIQIDNVRDSRLYIYYEVE